MIDYDPHDWHAHLLDVKGSMLREILARVLACVAWSTLVVVFHKFVRSIEEPATMHTLVGTALGLLLVFRTNSSNDRYSEGRKLWGGIVNTCRNLNNGARVHLAANREVCERVVLWTAAFPYACMTTLRKQSSLGPPANLLPGARIRLAYAADHLPSAVAREISEALLDGYKRGHYSSQVHALLEGNVQQLIDLIGGCERIRNTPLPFVYVVHLRRALILYCYTLPFVLVSTFGWLTIAATLLAAYTFFGIEEIGVEIEDPFGLDCNDLPLEQICARIESNLLSEPFQSHVGEPESRLAQI